MAEGEICCSTQLIDGDGNFNDAGMEQFSSTTGFSLCGLSYAIVAIMGPQSSGKSTLMNHMFNTNFREMDAFRGRSQTTKGIWMARCLDIDPFTIAMDLEGTDGRERGEDDTTFEKQSALFALAVADIVLINTWCHDIGREQAANMPLLKTVFQVMMRLFIPRRITLLFVIRDLEMTPLEYLESILREDIRKIWDAVPKPEKHKLTPLSEFFNVEVTALPSFYHRKDQFLEQVALLRQRFFHSISPGGLAGDRRAVVPASSFSFSVQQIWKVVKENKDLDFPAHKVMIATVRCEDVLNEKLKLFAEDERWLEISEAVQHDAVPEFGKKLSAILNTFMAEYEAETAFHDEGVKLTKGKQLRDMMLNLAYPSFVVLLDHLQAKAIQDFVSKLEESVRKGEPFAGAVRACKNSCVAEFDKKCKDAAVEIADWNSSKVREKLLTSIDSHAAEVRTKTLSELSSRYEKQLSEKLIEPVESLLEAGGSDAWSSIRKRLKEETETAVSEFSKALDGFELDAATSSTLAHSLREHARNMVEKKAREEAGKIMIRMKDRFSTVFNHDNDSMPRVWTGKEDIRSITKDARSASLKLLSGVAALRFTEKGDTIDNVLQSSLMEAEKSAKDRQIVGRMDPLASTSWPEVSAKDTIITPVQCKALWRQFKSETEYAVTQAIAAQEAYKQSNNWLPPPWAIVALLVLGFNEFMLLLKNPLYLLVIFVVYLLSKALWVQLDIPGEFRHGAVSGILSVSSRLLPTVMNLLKRLSEEAQGNKSPPQDQSSDISSLSDGEDRPTTPARNRRAISS